MGCLIPEEGDGIDSMWCPRACRHGGGNGSAGVEIHPRKPHWEVNSNGLFGSHELDPLGRLKPATKGVAHLTNREFWGRRLENTTDGMERRGRTDFPTNGTGNGRGMDVVGEVGISEPPKTRGDRPGTPRGARGTQTDQGGQTDRAEGARGGNLPTTRGIGYGTPEWGEMTQGPEGGLTNGNGGSVGVDPPP